MAAAEQIKSLIQSFGDKDDVRFFATAIQIAATEAKKGHTNVAQELKVLINKVKKERAAASLTKNKVIQLGHNRQELNGLVEVFNPQIKL
ncbi:MAG: ATPase, partial [Bacteroidota bacterium]